MAILPPISKQILLNRANDLAGKTLSEVFAKDQIFPDNLLRDKGWVGQAIEKLLGAESGSLPLPDFPHLGIELKTIPIDAKGKIRESTYICAVSLPHLSKETFFDSWVYHKVASILFIPIESMPSVPLPFRRIGTPFLFEPNAAQLAILKADWEELSEKIILGEWGSLSAHLGQYLQIRPKGTNARALCQAYDETGSICQTLPRGFYLRTAFTQSLFDAYYA